MNLILLSHPTLTYLTTNYYDKTYINNNVALLTNTYTKTESDNKFALITSLNTTNSNVSTL